jgi:spore maturation protein CgeB
VRLVIHGNFGHESYLGSSYKRAFEELGHEVVPFESADYSGDLSWWVRRRIPHRLTLHSLRLRDLGSRGWQGRFLDTIRRSAPELVLVLNGNFLMPHTLRAVRAMGRRVVIFHADNPFGPYACVRPEQLPVIPEVDGYLIWSRRLIERARAYGARRTGYLPFGWDPLIFPAGQLADRPDYDVVFVGNWDRHREDALTPVAQRFKLAIFGADYWSSRTSAFSPLRACWKGPVIGAQCADIFRRAKVSLNILREQNLPDGTNMRTFEIPGSGGFSLSNRTSGAEEILPDGEAAAYFDSTSDCLAKIEHYLARDEERRRMAARGHEIVAGGYTYRHLAEKILAFAAAM